MAILEFPDVDQADRDGLLAVGGDLEVESLLLAYQNGIFPWPLEQDLLAWFAPPERTLLFQQDLHLSRTLRRLLNNHPFDFSLNMYFEQVLKYCQHSSNRQGQGGTWITDPIVDGYCELHQIGAAYSVECLCDGKLVGGLYGVHLNGFVSGESMFYLEPNCSKLCLVLLMQLLKTKGIDWIDCQMTTPLLKSFGASEMPRTEFQRLLKSQIDRRVESIGSRKVNFGNWRGGPLSLNNG